MPPLPLAPPICHSVVTAGIRQGSSGDPSYFPLTNSPGGCYGDHSESTIGDRYSPIWRGLVRPADYPDFVAVADFDRGRGASCRSDAKIAVHFRMMWGPDAGPTGEAMGGRLTEVTVQALSRGGKKSALLFPVHELEPVRAAMGSGRESAAGQATEGGRGPLPANSTASPR